MLNPYNRSADLYVYNSDIWPGASLWHQAYNFPGGYCLEETPDPIPNSAVKLKDANGTAGAAPWESRSPPGLWSPSMISAGASPF